MQTWLNVYAITTITFKQCLRNKVILALFCLATLFIFINIVLTNLFSWDLGKVSVEIGLSVSAISGLGLILFLGIQLFTQDFEQQIIYLTVARPVTYPHYTSGKFLGVSFILALILTIFGFASAISLIYFHLYYPSFIPPFFSWGKYVLAYFFQWISLLVVLAFTLFWIAFAKQPFVAVMISFFSYLVAQNLELLRQFVGSLDKEQARLQIIAVKIISWLFPNLSLFDFKFVAAYGLPVNIQSCIIILLYGILCIFIFLFLATIFFKRKELV